MAVEKSCFEDFEVGEKFVSPGRTVTEADIVMFAALSGDWTELHTNAEFMKSSRFGKRIAHGLLTLAIASGLRLRVIREAEGLVIAFLGMDDVRFANPVFIGDTIWVESEVIEKRPSKSKANVGIVKFKNVIKNQRDEIVGTYSTTIMVRRGIEK